MIMSLDRLSSKVPRMSGASILSIVLVPMLPGRP
jgi:hypothetical protein